MQIILIKRFFLYDFSHRILNFFFASLENMSLSKAKWKKMNLPQTLVVFLRIRVSEGKKNQPIHSGATCTLLSQNKRHDLLLKNALLNPLHPWCFSWKLSTKCCIWCYLGCLHCLWPVLLLFLFLHNCLRGFWEKAQSLASCYQINAGFRITISFVLFCFEIGFYWGTLTFQKLTMYTRLASSSQSPASTSECWDQRNVPHAQPLELLLIRGILSDCKDIPRVL